MSLLLFSFFPVFSAGMSGTRNSVLMEQLNDVVSVFISKGDNCMEENDKSISICPWKSLQNKNMRSRDTFIDTGLLFIIAPSVL